MKPASPVLQAKMGPHSAGRVTANRSIVSISNLNLYSFCEKVGIGSALAHEESLDEGWLILWDGDRFDIMREGLLGPDSTGDLYALRAIFDHANQFGGESPAREEVHICEKFTVNMRRQVKGCNYLMYIPKYLDDLTEGLIRSHEDTSTASSGYSSANLRDGAQA